VRRRWLLQFLRWILKPFEWLFNALDGLPDAIRWLVVVGLALLLLLLLGHIVWTFIVAIRRAPVRSRRLNAERDRAIDPADLEREAETRGARGDYIEAIRLLFRAAVLRLQRAEKRPFRPGFTNRELLRRYQSSPLFDPLKGFVETIDAKWYGLQPCNPEDYAVSRVRHIELRKLIEERSDAVSA
jgi:hypothetical protein